jgi:signal transduction histidine kinase
VSSSDDRVRSDGGGPGQSGDGLAASAIAVPGVGLAVNPLAHQASLPALHRFEALRRRDSWVARHRSTIRLVLALCLAVLAPLAALALTVDLIPLLDGRPIGLPIVAAVVLVAWFGGVVPGLVAMGFVLLIEATSSLPPLHLDMTSGPDRIYLVMLVGTCILAVALASMRSRAERRSILAQRQAEAVLDRADVAARRLEGLQYLATDLTDAGTVDEMLDALVARSLVALKADRCWVAITDDDGLGEPSAIAVDQAAPSLGDDVAALGGRLLNVARTGEPLFDEGHSAELLGVAHAVAAVPIATPSGPGVLAFLWAHPHPLPDDRRAFIAALSRSGAAALDRHRMFAAEVAALRRAEAATGYLNVLADAGRTLGTTLDYEDLVQMLPLLGIPQLGIVGILDLEEEDGAVRRLAVSADPDLQGAVDVLAANPVRIPEVFGDIAALEAGHALSYRLVGEVIEQLDRSPEHLAALRAIAPAWLLQLPLTIQGTTSGLLTFMRRTDDPFDPAELFVGEELGRRAGRALENARLHHQIESLAELERRRAGELEAVIGSVEEGFLLADASGVIRSSNTAAERLLGGPVRSLDDLRARLLDASGQTPRSLPGPAEELRLQDRQNAWVEIASYRVAPSPDLGAASVVVVCRDVTAFRRGQALREAFMGLLSHELRTPVTTIYAGAAVLTRRGRELEPEVADEVLADVAAEANRLYRLVEDLMVLARFDEGIDLGSQPVLLQHLVPAAVESEASRWPAVSFECSAEPDLPTVGGDETAIAQVVRNLLSNAAKYSPVGGRVQVQLRGDSGGVAVAVRDEGPGIDPTEAEKIFDPFYRSPSTAGQASGAGIGLYVSRRLVDAMDGRITAASADGTGSEFSFVLPLYHADDGA